MRARVCFKCEEYIIVRTEFPQGEAEFEKTHAGHMMITADLEEVKDKYLNVSSKYSNQ